jgi:hypothetical protein
MTTVQAYPPATDLPRANRVRIVTIPARRYLAIDGEAAPGSPAFQAAMSALYACTYALHFLLRERGIESPVSPPEALWERRDGGPSWAEGPIAFDPVAWRWSLLIALPDEAADDDIASCVAVARRRHASEALDHVAVRTLREGVAVEAMHVGPYEAEPETIARMHHVAREAGLRPRGPHHEIYLGDPRRTDPRQLRTVLRQPLH